MEATAIDAYQTAIKFLARREHSAHELAQKLKQKGYVSEQISEALLQLKQEKLQSDERFVEMFVRTRQNQGYGPIKIATDLQNKGVSSSLVGRYLKEESSEWYALAAVVYQKKFGLTQPADYQDKAKRMRFLQYRGFTMGQIGGVFE